MYINNIIIPSLFLTIFTSAKEWIPLKPADSTHYINYSIILHHNEHIKKNIFNKIQEISDIESKSYGNYLTNNELYDIVKVDDHIINNVTKYISSKNTYCNILGDSLFCKSSIYDIEKLFNVSMWIFINKNTKEYKIRSLNNYVIPPELHSYIDFIDGISNKFITHNYKIKSYYPIQSIDNRFVGRESLIRMYNFSNNPVINSSIAAVEFRGGGFKQNQLNNNSIANGLIPWNVSHIIGNNPGSGTETTLDLSMIIDVADKTELWYMNYPRWILGMTHSIQIMNKKPQILSLSYGWAEWDQCSIIICNNTTAKKYIERTNIELAKLGLLGITVVVASGDAGSPGRTNEECDTSKHQINPVFPGSSPYILSVGATANLMDNSTVNWNTTLCNNNGCATGIKTTPANYQNLHWTSGSGFSNYENTPSWQKNAVKQYLNSGVKLPNNSYWNNNGRGYPDVTANGHNCPIFDDYGFESVDGTSCSTPIWASIIGIINNHQIKNNRPIVGFINPLLYKMTSLCPHIFTPVNNPGYSHCTEMMCCPDDFGFYTPSHKTLWNPITGLGQPNVNNILSCLDKIFN